MPNDFSTRAGGSSLVNLNSFTTALTAPNVSVGLGLIDSLGRPLKVGHSHNVELGFAEFFLTATGSANDTLELQLVSGSSILYRAGDSYTGFHQFEGDVNIGADAASSSVGVLDTSTFTVVGGLSTLNGGIMVNPTGSAVFSVDSANGNTLVAGTLEVDGVADFDSTAGLVGFALGADADDTTAAVRVNGALVADGQIHSFLGISSSGAGDFDTLNVGGGFDSGATVTNPGLSVDTDGNLSTNGFITAQGNLTVGQTGSSHTMTGDVAITGNLTVAGNVVQEDSIVVQFNDTILEIGKDADPSGSGASSTLDLGLKLHYNDGISDKLAGFIWDAKGTANGKFNLFSELADSSGGAADDIIDAGATHGDLQIADLTAIDGTFTGSVSLGDNATTGSGDQLTINAEIQSHLLPAALKTLGESARRWSNAYLTDADISEELVFSGATGDNKVTFEEGQANALEFRDDDSLASNTATAMVFDSTSKLVKFSDYGIDASLSTITSNLNQHSVVFAGAGGVLSENTGFTFVTADHKLQIAADSGNLESASIVIRDENGGSGVDKFSVDLSGNTFAGGTLEVDGIVNLDATTPLSVGGSHAATTGALLVDGGASFALDVKVWGALGVDGEATLASAIVSDLTDDRIVIVGSSNELEDNANFRFTGSSFLIGDSDGTTVGGVFNVAVGTGNTFVAGTLDVDSTSTFADVITLDGTNPGNRKIVSTDEGMTIQTIDSGAGSNPGLSLNSAGALSMTGDNVSIGSTADDIDIESNGHIRLIPNASEQIMLENLDVQSEAASQDASAVNNQGITANLSIGSDNDPDAGAYSSALIMSLIKEYEKEDSETKAHIVVDASQGTPTARATHSAQVEHLLGLVNIDESGNNTLDFDLTENRGVGHLYSKLSAFDGGAIITASGIANGDTLTLEGQTITFKDDAGFQNDGGATGGFFTNTGAGAFTVNLESNSAGPGDAKGIESLQQLINGDPAFGSIVVNGYSTGNVSLDLTGIVNPSIVASNPATITVGVNSQQPELYWENLKIAKWTGNSYGFGTDLQAAYASSSADADIPAILLGNNYDLDIQVDSTADFKLRSSESSFDEFTVSFSEKSDQKGLSFQDANMYAMEAIVMGSPVRSVATSKIVITLDNTINYATFTGNGDIAFEKDDAFGGGGAHAQLTDGGVATKINLVVGPAIPSNGEYNTGNTVQETAQNIANAINQHPAHNAVLFAEAIENKVIITAQIETAARVMASSNGLSGGNLIALAEDKIISGIRKADASVGDCIGVIAKSTNQIGDSVELLVPGQLFEPNGLTSSVFGDEVFVAEGASAGSVIGSSAVASLSPGSYIYSLGYVVALGSQEIANGGGTHAAGTSKAKVVYQPRFVALLPS